MTKEDTKQEHGIDDNNISMVTKHQDNYTSERRAIIHKVFNMRPAATLGSGIMLFEQKKHIECIDYMVEKVLSQNCSPDYYHLALGYICLCFGRMSLTENAKLIIEEMHRIKVPVEYDDYGRRLISKLNEETDTVIRETHKIKTEKEIAQKRRTVMLERRRLAAERLEQEMEEEANKKKKDRY